MTPSFVISVEALPVFMLWNWRSRYRQSSEWLAHPIVRIIRIALVAIISFFVLMIIGSLFMGVLIPYETQLKFNEYLNVLILIFIVLTAIGIANLYRKTEGEGNSADKRNRND